MAAQPDLHNCKVPLAPDSVSETWTCPECSAAWDGGTVRHLTIPDNWHIYDPEMLDALAWRTSTGPSADWDGASQGCGTVSRMIVLGDWT